MKQKTELDNELIERFAQKVASETVFAFLDGEQLTAEVIRQRELSFLSLMGHGMYLTPDEWEAAGKDLVTACANRLKPQLGDEPKKELITAMFLLPEMRAALGTKRFEELAKRPETAASVKGVIEMLRTAYQAKS